mmetsp:Transcript_161/g.228  ORF Transcript_161/g.228 Transcript_161/m.228 type:complete len:376 (-) Transcript_161:237-1364(-)|eukprot:CAMPEP_0196579212 /NCGR_PEP_ID=MMETSP1081-20130531/19038_1 /TAXON_ID=36882 /ORGANISM="Pyramimonas amylifera, Strain CCMP720" /LENGTH=375 /DNA_ID=CAMNT_0041898717 /DNA_START=62 /DNA_END=1189 /DNA_ORIENTATION=+
MGRTNEKRSSGANKEGICIGGHFNLDLIRVINEWPEEQKLCFITAEETGNGGGAYNTLKDLANMQTPFPLEAIGVVGDDAYGKQIVIDCKDSKIGVSKLLVVSGEATSYTNVFTVKNTGKRTFFHQPGTNKLVDLPHFDFTNNNCKHFHLAYLPMLERLSELGPDGSNKGAEVMKRAKVAGMRTSMDLVVCPTPTPTFMADVVTPALPYTDVLVMNMAECEMLTRVCIPKAADGAVPYLALVACQQVLALGVQQAVVLHFPQGCISVSKDQEPIVQGTLAVPDGYVAGSDGAGDAFAAGLLLGWHKDAPWEECLKLAVAASCASLSHVTCSNGVPSETGCLELASKFGYMPLVCLKSDSSSVEIGENACISPRHR